MMDMDMDRRSFVAGASAIATASIAGCSGAADLGGGGVFESVDVDGTDLVVRLEDDDIEQVSLIREGELQQEHRLAAGETSVAFPLIEMGPRGVRAAYHAGDHTIVADDGDETHEYEIDLSPDSEIVAIEIPDESEPGFVAIAIENTGTAPEVVFDASITDPAGEVDRELEFDTDRDDGNAFMRYDEEIGGDSEYFDHFPIEPESTAAFRPWDSALGFTVSSGWDADPDDFESLDELEAALRGETLEIEIAIDGWERLEATAEILLEGDATQFRRAEAFFEEMEVVDFETH
jgi:hypothetical protein